MSGTSASVASTRKGGMGLNPGGNTGADSSQESRQGSSEMVGNQATVAASTDTKDKPLSRDTLLACSKAINSIIVSPKQRGNPILKFVRNVPWEFGDIVPDYQLGQSRCALYLSLKYHNLNRQYIHERLKQLGHSYDLRVMLVQIDTLNPHHALKEIANICILADCTLILAFSTEEAGRYLETYKSFENKPPDLVMERTEKNYLSRMTECLTNVKTINKTDSATLLSTFHSFQKIVEASQEDLSLCPGFGPQKAKRLHAIFHQPFLKAKRPKAKQSPDKNTSPTKSPRKDFFTNKSSLGSGSPAKKSS